MSVKYKIRDQQEVIPLWTKAPTLLLSAKPTGILGTRLKPSRQRALGLGLGSFALAEKQLPSEALFVGNKNNMTAQELLAAYAKGERNFSGANLSTAEEKQCRLR